jgi:hypothetical protein
VRYVEIDISLENAITCKSMFRHLQTSTAHSINLWVMMRRTVEVIPSYMKYQGISTKFKVKYNKKGRLRSIIPLEEETSTLVVDSEEEDEEEAWAEVEVISFVIIVHNQVIWQGNVKNLVPRTVTSIHLNMS